MEKFYDQIMQAILRHVDFSIIKCVVLSSPGFVKVSTMFLTIILYNCYRFLTNTTAVCAILFFFAVYRCMYIQDALLSYMMSQAVRNDIRVLIENKSKFLLVRSSSGHRHALKEVMADPIVVGQLADTKVRLSERE